MPEAAASPGPRPDPRGLPRLFRGKGRVLVLTHRNPDPDALGAAVGLMHLLREAAGAEPTLAMNGAIFRAENREMVDLLEIPLVAFNGLDRSRFGAGVMVDTQPGFGHTVTPPDVPLLAVIDHHVSPAGELPTVPFFDVQTGYGATSTLVYEYLRALALAIPTRVATALLCGVRFDTADLQRNASPADSRAYDELLHLSDRRLLAQIKNPSLPPEYFRELRRAIGVARSHGGIVLAFLGRLTNPDMVAEVADLLLRYRGTKWTLVGGHHEGTYYVSLRIDTPGTDAYPMIRRILDGEGTFGGHGRIAGARIPVQDKSARDIHALQRRIRARALALAGETGTPIHRIG
ncbi:MAG TPA: DHH family phosphoesterase [Planctomycetota bacterium]|jgi:nanoRNase/pAp phosphatase (c-di-AMP/oligoRNAs hydrolase)|nr:DHH family phosphoesterase [Planctomycetota bacterium]